VNALENKIVVLTGASEGIGRSLALRLAARHARLVLAARNQERLESLVKACSEAGAQAVAVPTDVTDPDQCKALIQATVDHFGGVDILIANAGATMWSRFDELEDLTIIERIMAVNYYGAVYCTKFALPWLKRSKGQIVAVASVAGMTGVPTRSGYSATKHAMVGFFDSLRIELADDGVAVTLVAPDFVVTEIHRRAFGATGQPLGKTPMQESRIMTADRCAELIVEATIKRKRLLITSRRGRLGRWLKLIWPGLIDRIARRAIEKRY